MAAAATAIKPQSVAATAPLTIGVRQLRSLVEPVIPSASGDDMLPVLNAVLIETSGKWLVATATDRFAIAIKRVAASEDEPWPASWSALVPLSTLRGILSTFRASVRDRDPAIELTVMDDLLHVTSSAGLLDMREASIVYPLQSGEYPTVRGLLRNALLAEPGASTTSFDPARLTRLLSKVDARAVAMKCGGEKRDPLAFTDGENFFGLLMPRSMPDTPEPFAGNWADLFAEVAK